MSTTLAQPLRKRTTGTAENHSDFSETQSPNVYAALASDGILKIGISYTPEARIRAHHKAAETRGATLTHTWFWYHDAPASAESMLEQVARRCGSRAWGREWFKDVDIPLFLECVNNLRTVAFDRRSGVFAYGYSYAKTGGDFMRYAMRRIKKKPQ